MRIPRLLLPDARGNRLIIINGKAAVQRIETMRIEAMRSG
jgi:hypothetical protein